MAREPILVERDLCLIHDLAMGAGCFDTARLAPSDTQLPQRRKPLPKYSQRVFAEKGPPFRSERGLARNEGIGRGGGGFGGRGFYWKIPGGASSRTGGARGRGIWGEAPFTVKRRPVFGENAFLRLGCAPITFAIRKHLKAYDYV